MGETVSPLSPLFAVTDFWRSLCHLVSFHRRLLNNVLKVLGMMIYSQHVPLSLLYQLKLGVAIPIYSHTSSNFRL